MTLDAAVELDVGSLTLRVALVAAEGETVAVLGPNGAGKTTLLRALAGLMPIDGGRIALDGTVLDDAASGTFVPPERRPVGMVFQDHLLLPHLSVLDNVAFGLRPGRRRSAARLAAAPFLAQVGLADRAADRPAALSGGQAQRVALARALALEPRLLLLDEPLAALDATVRADTRRELRRHLRGFAGMRVLVTHDPLDALTLADRLVVVEGGRISQAGTPAEVAARPRSSYAADLAGVNLLAGTGEVIGVRLATGAVLVAGSVPPSGPAFAVVHPRAVALHRQQPEGSARNVWACTVASTDAEGDRVRVQLAGPVPLVAEITSAAASELGLVPGGEVWASVKATEVAVYEA